MKTLSCRYNVRFSPTLKIAATLLVSALASALAQAQTDTTATYPQTSQFA